MDAEPDRNVGVVCDVHHAHDPHPGRTGSGRFTVTTSNGTAVSADDFFVPPSPYSAVDVASTQRLAIGATTNVVIGTAAKIALLVFDGTSGQRVGLKIVPGPISTVPVSSQPDRARRAFDRHSDHVDGTAAPSGHRQLPVHDRPGRCGNGNDGNHPQHSSDYTGTIQPDSLRPA